ncbi:MAG: Fur family transcriptional regulator [Kineosporiaceae bacterium]|jgi:Fur family ferric uptake transcriptional regulator
MVQRGSDVLGDALRSRGLRMTPQRRLVLDAVHALGHGTPEQVAERVQRTTPSLSLSTVYRTLDLLEEMGVVTHTHLGHRAPAYHAVGHADHIHLVCRRCGGVEEADVGGARALADEVRGRYGFSTDVAHLSLDGTCADCLPGSGKHTGPADAED